MKWAGSSQKSLALVAAAPSSRIAIAVRIVAAGRFASTTPASSGPRIFPRITHVRSSSGSTRTNMSGDVELVAELANVSKVFLDGWRREVRAVAGLTLCLRRGEIYGLLGPNGAGKSTALHCLLGLLRPSQGTAKLFGQSVEVGAPLFQRVGYMPEDWTAYDFLTVAEMLEVFADLHGVDRTRRRAQVRQALDRSGLTEHANRRLRRLSKGMRQRASLAQAILGEPDLLILDEPTKELDPLGRRDVRVLLGQLAQNGVTVLLSSHLLSEIETVCHRIGVMH